ncbi:MAG: reverse transcriptase domain-containing protein, partial [Sciscionella sp.]
VRTPPEVLAVMPRAADPQLRADRWWLVRRLAAPHLPQGAPSSPAAANIVAYRLDRRLCGLAEAMGARYTRYADDLAFSSVAGLDTVALCSAVGSICAAEGFRVRTDKTRIARAHQSQRLAGLVVNADPAPSRRAYDELRAVLHNCARTGPEEQNRSGHADFRAHLRGRMAWLSAGRPNRAARLQGLFDRIVW